MYILGRMLSFEVFSRIKKRHIQSRLVLKPFDRRRRIVYYCTFEIAALLWRVSDKPDAHKRYVDFLPNGPLGAFRGMLGFGGCRRPYI